MTSWNEWEVLRRQFAEAAQLSPFRWLERFCRFIVAMIEDAQKEIADKARNKP